MTDDSKIQVEFMSSRVCTSTFVELRKYLKYKHLDCFYGVHFYDIHLDVSGDGPPIRISGCSISTIF